MPEAVAPPVASPKQAAGVVDVMEAERAAAGCVIVTAWRVEHPLASITVQVQMPAGRLFAVAPFCTGVVFHWKV